MQVGWSWHPSVLIGMGLWTVAYVLLTGVWRQEYGWGEAPTATQSAAFHFGTVVGLVALVSPLDKLGDEFLFSAHMVQHLLLMYVTAPCWLMGSPGWIPTLLLPSRWLRFARGITSPVSALLVFGGVTLAWHIPAAYGLAQRHEWLHIIQHLTYIGAALIGWWPLLGPESAVLPRPAAPIRLLYVFFTAMPCTFLAALLTFAGRPLYGFYMAAPHPFGLGALEDQRLGGLLMWIPTHMILLLCLSVIGAKWLNDKGGPSGLPAEYRVSEGARLHERTP